jgi:hypothetical protein
MHDVVCRGVHHPAASPPYEEHDGRAMDRPVLIVAAEKCASPRAVHVTSQSRIGAAEFVGVGVCSCRYGGERAALMANMPVAELPITLEFAERLVGAQFPDLVRHPFHHLTEGWDNVVVRIGTEYAVRIPRRQAAVQRALNEHRWLALVAQRAVSGASAAPPRSAH